MKLSTLKEQTERILREDDAIILAAGDIWHVESKYFPLSYFIIFDNYYQSLVWC